MNQDSGLASTFRGGYTERMRPRDRRPPLPRFNALVLTFMLGQSVLIAPAIHRSVAHPIQDSSKYSSISLGIPPGNQPPEAQSPKLSRFQEDTTDTPTEIPTESLTPSLTDTPADTEALTPTTTDTPADTETLTPTTTDAPADTETLTPTETETLSDTESETPSETPTPTPTETQIPPVNDDFDQPISISALPYANEARTSGAIPAADDPEISCAADGAGPQSNSVWYSFTADRFEAVTFDTEGSDYNTVLAVWRGTRGNLVNMGCNDDYHNEQSRLTLSLAPGAYTVEVAQSGEGTGGTLLFHAAAAEFHGLRADYFNNPDLSGSPALTRVDPGINFNWSWISPAPEIPVNDFSVRWSGQVFPQYSETYTFYTNSDDGVRLWVDGQPLINDWMDRGSRWDQADIALQAGVGYDIRMEYYQREGESVAELDWSSASQGQEVVPEDRLGYQDTANSTAVSDGVHPVADGVATSQITVTVLDSSNDPVGGVAVYLRATDAGNLINDYPAAANEWIPIGSSDSSGRIVGYLASTVLGQTTVQAMAGGNVITPAMPVTFSNDPMRKVSVSQIPGREGEESDADSSSPSISDDGKYAVFLSAAGNLIPGIGNENSEIFILNTETNDLFPAIFAASGGQPDASIVDAKISGDGRFVVFTSPATNLDPQCAGGHAEIFVYEIREGQPGIFTCISQSSDRGEANGISEHPSISTDGRFIVYESNASNLVEGVGSDYKQIYLYDSQTHTTELISAGSGGEPGNGDSDNPSVSADGQHIAFESSATNLLGEGGDTNGVADIFLRDRSGGGTTTRVSAALSASEEPNGPSVRSSISSDGNRVAFVSHAGNLVTGASDVWNVFLRDIPSQTTTLISVSSTGEAAVFDSYTAAISADGMHVVFSSLAINLVEGENHGTWQIYLRDLEDSTTSKISVSADGSEGDGTSAVAAVSGDGTRILFLSEAGNLITPDDNGFSDVFLAHRAEPVNPPPNDGFDLAVPVGSLPFVAENVNIGGATNTRDDPAPDCGGGAYSNSVWYVYDSPGTQNVDVNTAGSDYDTVLAVWAGARGSLTQVGCDDDSNGAQSELTFPAHAGTRYWIEVVRKGASGGGLLRLSVVAESYRTPTETPTETPSPTPTATETPLPRTNDDFDDALSMPALPFSAELQTSFATTAGDDPVIECAAGGPGRQSYSVWYSYTPSDFEAISLDTAGSDFNTVVAVWRGVRGSLIPVACGEDSPLAASLAPGYTYYIEVAQSGEGTGGTLRLHAEAAEVHGLRADYFDNVDLSGSPVLTRVDPEINFFWTGTSPAPEIPVNDFSVRWSGWIVPSYSETYTFYTHSDDGVRLWVDGQLVIEDWGVHSPKWDQGDITLQAGRGYSIRMEYFQGSGDSVAELDWSSASQDREVVPTDRLDYLEPPAPTETPTPTQTETPTETPTLAESETSTPTETQTLTPTSTPAEAIALQVLLPGETPLPGAFDGKTGTPSVQTAGISFTVIVRAMDFQGMTVPYASGTVSLASDDPRAEISGPVDLTEGVAVFTVTLKTAGSRHFTASLGGLPDASSAAVVVNSGPVDHFTFSLPNTINLLEGFSISLAAFDSYGNPVTDYLGPVHFISSDSNGVVPGDTAFASGTGTQTISGFVFRQGGEQSITVSDAANPMISSRVSVSLSNDLIVTGSATLPAGDYSYNSVLIQNGGVLYLQGDTTTGTGVTIRAGNITIAAGGILFADGLGYGMQQGPGKGNGDGNLSSSGAGHGGLGGSASVTRFAAGNAYDSIFEPTGLGSGGGLDLSCHESGGGGAIRLIVSDVLAVEGKITSNAKAGTSTRGYQCGGASGGSIWVKAGIFSGYGEISADGGPGNRIPNSGGGGGGRIAIDVQTDSFMGSIHAYGGSGYQAGGAGTIYWAQPNRLKIDNNSRTGAPSALIEGNYQFSALEMVRNGDLAILGTASSLILSESNFTTDGTAELTIYGTLHLPETFSLSNLWIDVRGLLDGVQNLDLGAGGKLTLHAYTPLNTEPFSFTTIHVLTGGILYLAPYDNGNTDYSDDLPLELHVSELTVDSGGVITSDGLGYANGLGPGAGTIASSSTHTSGGGYGGQGGIQSDYYYSAGGNGYGSAILPVDLGSGGGKSYSCAAGGISGSGGGAIVLIVSGSFVENGKVSANGLNGLSGNECGGGSGGSIRVEAHSFSGAGEISADGGSGSGTSYYGFGGNGGGGRIAINTPDDSFSGSIHAFGGNAGGKAGGAGTIYWSQPNHLKIDNNNQSGAPAVLFDDGSHQFMMIEIVRKGDLILAGTDSSLTLAENSLSTDGTAVFTVYGTLHLPDTFTVFNGSIDVRGALDGGQNLILGEGGKLTLRASTPLYTGPYSFTSIQILSKGILYLVPYDNGNTIYTDDLPFELHAGQLSIDPGGILFADGFGYPGTMGNGLGPGGGIGIDYHGWEIESGSGGGYGGIGGEAYTGKPGGSTYGDLYRPVALGSSGGSGAEGATYYPGGSGGGAIHLVISGTLTVNGLISADGSFGQGDFTPGYYPVGAGGGAGGSIWIEAPIIFGGGSIEAKGGNAAAGPGGGGRIAVYSANLDPSVSFSVAGGTGGMGERLGGTGSIFTNGVDPYLSTIALSADPVIADGSQSTTLTVTILDSSGAPIQGKVVVLAVSPADSVLVNGQPISSDGRITLNPTDANGRATVSLSSTLAEPRTITARIGPVELRFQPVLHFVSGVPDPSKSSYQLSSPNVPADGDASAQFTITLKDAFGNPVAGATAVLSATGKADLIQPEATDASGMATGYVKDSLPETVQVTVNVNGVAIGSPSQVHFSGSDVRISITAQSLTNDGLSGTNAVSGQPITYTLTVGNDGMMHAEGVTVTDTLPDGFTFYSQTNNFPSQITGNTITWTLGTVLPGDTKEIQFIAVIGSGVATGAYIDTAAVSTTTQEDSTANNSVSLTTAVENPAPRITLSPSTPTLTVLRGATGTLAAILKNTGLGPMANIVIQPPPTLPWVTVDTTAVPSLAAGAQVSFTITASPDASITPGTYRDYITVTADGCALKRIALSVVVTTPSRPLAVTVQDDQGALVPGANVAVVKRDVSVNVTQGKVSTYHYTEQHPTGSDGTAAFAALEVGIYDVTASAANHAVLHSILTITEDSGTQTATLILTAQPLMVLTPANPSIGVMVGQLGSTDLTITNQGAAPLRGITLISPGNIPWVSLSLPATVPDLAPGESVTVGIIAQPLAGQGDGKYEGYVTVRAEGGISKQAGLTVDVSNSVPRDVLFELKDDQGSSVTGSGKVILVRQEPETITQPDGKVVTYNPNYTLPLAADGTALFTGLKPGTYNYQISADGYEAGTGIVFVTSGDGIQNNPITMNSDPVKFTWWNVLNNRDTYDITLTMTYDVLTPAPILKVMDQCILDTNDHFSIPIFNPSAIPITIDSISFSGTGIEIGDHGITIGAGASINVPVNVSSGNGQTGGSLDITYHYAQVPDDSASFTLNPSSDTSPDLPVGTVWAKEFQLAIVQPAPGRSYSVEIDRTHLPDWITISDPVPASGGVIINQAAEVDGFALHDSIFDVPITVSYIDGEGTKFSRTGTLHYVVSPVDDSIQIHTNFETGNPPIEEKKATTSAHINISGNCEQAQWSGSQTGGGYQIVGAVVGATSNPFNIPGQAPVFGSGNQELRVEMSQQFMLDGESFNASLGIENKSQSTLADMSADVRVFLDGQDATGQFTILPVSVPTGTMAPGDKQTAEWTLVPNVGDLPAEGKKYIFQAVVHYRIGSQPYVNESEKREFFVYPSPSLVMTYVLPLPSVPCTEFELGLWIYNYGPGPARRVVLNSMLPKVVDKTTGMPITFNITGATLSINGSTPVPVSPLEFEIEKIPEAQGADSPGVAVIRWKLTTNIPGKFVGFTSNFRHIDPSNQYIQPILHRINTIFDTKASACGVSVTEQSVLNQSGECFGSAYRMTQGVTGGPINTRTGAYDYSVTDFSIPTSAGPLTFTRWYSSLGTQAYSKTLGYGWTHSLETYLIFPGDPGGKPNEIILKGMSANQFEFFDNGDGTYTAYPGLCGKLEKLAGPPVTYVIADNANMVYTFDAGGKLISVANPQGAAMHYEYDGNGKLTKVRDDVGGKYLTFAYDAQGRLQSASDYTGRTVSYAYDGTTGDLASAADVFGKAWTYAYDAAHRMTRVIDPRGVNVERTEYDDQGRAVRQYDGMDRLIVELTYNADGSTTVRDGAGHVQTHIYDERGVLTGNQNAAGGTTQKEYDSNFHPTTVTDPLGNASGLAWSADGIDLTGIIDPYGKTTSLGYDSGNNLSQITDPLGNITRYIYDGTRLMEKIDAAGHSTRYTYTLEGWLETVTDPLGRTTRYTYDASGQVTSVTQPGGLVTHYTYDDLGRRKTVADSSGKTAWTCYDAAGRIVRTVANATGDGSSPASNPCDADNYRPSGASGFDRISITQFDDVGNVIARRDPEGRVTRTYYDSSNRPIAETRNLTGWDILNPQPPPEGQRSSTENVTTFTVYDDAGQMIASIAADGTITRTFYDSAGRPAVTVSNCMGETCLATTLGVEPPAYNPAHPEWNIRSETDYDRAGNVVETRDNAGRVTHYCYDKLGRAELTVQNPSVADPCGSYAPSGAPDQDLITRTIYDANGNAVAQIDPAGRVTRTYYDALNRPYLTVQNCKGEVCLAPNSTDVPAYNPAHPDQNIHSETRYDAAGRAFAQLDTLGRVTRTYYDSAGRQVITVRNCKGGACLDPDSNSAPSYDPAHPDWNVRTETIYDADGRAIATQDALGYITRIYYDDAGRVWLTVRNLSHDWDPQDASAPNYDPNRPDVNIRTRTYYDADGRAFATVDTLGGVSRTYYDALDRPYLTVQNCKGEACLAPDNGTAPAYNPAHPDQNIHSEMIYDAAGRMFATIDTLGRVTRTFYDSAGRPVITVRNCVGAACLASANNSVPSYDPAYPDRNVRSETRYNAAGQAYETVDNAGVVTYTDYDQLGRAIAVTANYVSGGPEDAATNLTTGTVYDKAGNPIERTDARGIVTRYEYDGRGLLTAVIENACTGGACTAPTNVRTEYTYDAYGNRATIKDANGHITTSAYDELGRLVSETDPLEHATRYQYDALGQRVSMTDKMGFTTAYTYDGLGRLVFVDYPDPDSDVSFIYDGLGRRLSMDDTVGCEGAACRAPTAWTYDGLGRALSVTDPFGKTVQYGYDGAGDRTLLAYPAGTGGQPSAPTATYAYDGLGRLISVSAVDMGGQPSAPTAYAYDSSGRLAATTLPNGILTTYTYDAAGNLLAIQHTRGTETIAKYEYEYDRAGNRVKATETVLQPNLVPQQTPLAFDPNQKDWGNGAAAAGGLGYASPSGLPADPSGAGLAAGIPAGFVPRSVAWILGGPSSGLGLLNLIQPPVPAADYSLGMGGAANGSLGSARSYVPPAASTAVTVTVLNTDNQPESGLNVYAFNGTTYTGVSAKTGANGQATLSLPDGSYRFRADKNGTQFWSGTANHCTTPTCASASITTTIPVTVTVTRTDGAAESGLNVYAFTGTTYSGYSGKTDSRGQVSLTLPLGSYRFRADKNGTQFWSGTDTSCAIPGCQTASVSTTIPVTVTVLNTDAVSEPGLTVYAYTGTTYSGYSAKTDANGQVSLTLPIGSYRFRADKNGTQFWSGTANSCTIPSCTTASVTTTIPVMVTVTNTSGAAEAGLNVYAFTGTTYTGYSGKTDSNGQVSLTLPIGSYKFRADKDGTQFWSGTDNNCTIPSCTAASVTTTIPVTVTVTNTSGAAEAGLNVYAFNGTTYTGYSGKTDSSGQVSLTLPTGSYRFRADKNGTQFWSGTANNCTIPSCTAASVTVTNGIVVTVLNSNGLPEVGLNVYAFTGTTYSGYSGKTDANGQVSLTLPVGSYRFRADKNGTQYWSSADNSCTIPVCSGASIFTTLPVTVTVANTSGAAEAGLNVYAFTGTTYSGYSVKTDAQGRAVFTLPGGSYRFRADKNGTQFWSGTDNGCPIPGCTSASITTTNPVVVTVLNTSGAAEAGLNVYAFNGTTYTGYSGKTDSNGQVSLTLPIGSYRFRADKNGTQFWSGTDSSCTIPGCASASVTTTNPVVVTVLNTSGAAEAGLNVYAFNGTTYTGYSGKTDSNGQVSLTLPIGSYRFRADKNGTQFWSGTENSCAIPSCASASVTTTLPVTVTVQDTGGTTQAGLSVYAFNGTTYTGYSGKTDINGQVTLTLPQGSYRFRADKDGTQYWSSATNNCIIPGCVQAAVTLPGGAAVVTKTITYTYDGLNRLTAADYDTGEYFHYTYDNVGNRLSEGKKTTPAGAAQFTAYTYDAANRMIYVGGVAYTWDDNGNLLSDGTYTYIYNHANRLTMVNGPSSIVSFIYNGLGDRISETDNGVTTYFTLDINNNLTQVLSDGTHAYLYGLGRIAQVSATDSAYFLGDALGSVRQLANGQGTVTLAQAYEPYGSVMSASGEDATKYGFMGEMQENSLVFLRARYYNDGTGEFTGKDAWQGDKLQPMSYNPWLFTFDNPINRTDPSGNECIGEGCQTRTNSNYDVRFIRDEDPMELKIKLKCGTPKTGGPNPPNTGFFEGLSQYGGGGLGGIWGDEIVYDFATMESAHFSYIGTLEGAFVGAGTTMYQGLLEGFKWNSIDPDHQFEKDYSGESYGWYGGGGVSALTLGAGFLTNEDHTIKGNFGYVSVGGSGPAEVVSFETYYKMDYIADRFADRHGMVDFNSLANHIGLGWDSPIKLGADTVKPFIDERLSVSTMKVLWEINAYERYWQWLHTI